MKPLQIFLLVVIIAGIGVAVSRLIPHSPSINSELNSTESLPPLNPDLAPQAAAILRLKEGSAVLIRNGERFSAPDAMAFMAGDRVEVGELDVEVIWPHYGRTRLEAKSIVVFQKVFESTNRERFEVKFSLEQGRAWTRFYDTLFQGQSFQVRVGSVLVDASGGSFGLTRGKDGDVLIEARTQAVRALAVRDDVPTGEMRKMGFDEMYAETAISELREIGGRAVMMSQAGTITDTEPSSDAFVEAGEAPFSEKELEVEPSSATLLPESSL